MKNTDIDRKEKYKSRQRRMAQEERAKAESRKSQLEKKEMHSKLHDEHFEPRAFVPSPIIKAHPKAKNKPTDTKKEKAEQ